MKAKNEAIQRYLLKQPMASDRRIVTLLGCKSRDVQQVRRDMVAAGEIKRMEADKKGRRVWTLL